MHSNFETINKNMDWLKNRVDELMQLSNDRHYIMQEKELQRRIRKARTKQDEAGNPRTTEGTMTPAELNGNLNRQKTKDVTTNGEDKRKCNLVFYNVPESTSTEASKRIEEDIVFCKNIIEKELDISEFFFFFLR